MIFRWEKIKYSFCYNFSIFLRKNREMAVNGKKMGRESLRQRLLSAERRLPCLCSTTKWDPRQECKAIRRMHTGAFCGVTKPILLTTTTSEVKNYPHRQSHRVYSVERGNAAILRRHPYYLLLTMMVLRLPIQTGDSSSKVRASDAFRC